MNIDKPSSEVHYMGDWSAALTKPMAARAIAGVSGYHNNPAAVTSEVETPRDIPAHSNDYFYPPTDEVSELNTDSPDGSQE